jgi:carboxyl-terminal processing protease
MTGKLEGIGASRKEQDHYIVVHDLIPGGASWQQGKLEIGDLILAVAQENKDPVDAVDLPIDKVVSMIRGPKGTVVVLTVKKADGHIENISITRDVVRIEATYARGAVVKLDKKSDPVGYVYLPGFYGDVGARAKPGERNATDDVRAVLNALQKKKVSSLVLDLRGNGGGLLTHARDISGLFIPQGPVVQTKDSDEKIEVLSDTDPSIASAPRRPRFWRARCKTTSARSWWVRAPRTAKAPCKRSSIWTACAREEAIRSASTRSPCRSISGSAEAPRS